MEPSSGFATPVGIRLTTKREMAYNTGQMSGCEGAKARTFGNHMHKCEHFRRVGFVSGGRPCGVAMAILLWVQREHEMEPHLYKTLNNTS